MMSYVLLCFYTIVISCGVLETPRFGRKSNFLFVPNTKVTFECNQEFVLIGDQRRSCSADGKWDIPEYGYTECLRKYLYKHYKRHKISCYCFNDTQKNSTNQLGN